MIELISYSLNKLMLTELAVFIAIFLIGVPFGFNYKWEKKMEVSVKWVTIVFIATFLSKVVVWIWQ